MHAVVAHLLSTVSAMKERTVHRLIALLCLTSLLLAACGPAQEEDGGPLTGQDPAASTPTAQPAGTTPAAGTTISFAVWDAERRTYETLAAAFHAEHPTITVVIVSLDELVQGAGQASGDDELTQLRRVVSGADTAAQSTLSASAASSGLLLDMTALMNQDASFTRDDFYPGMLERGMAQQRQVMLPRARWVPLLAYNKDRFTTAGVPLPTASWTWRDLFQAAEQLAAHDRKGYGFLDRSDGLSALIAQLMFQQSTIFDAPPQQGTLTQPQQVQALTALKAWVENRTLYRAKTADASATTEQQELLQAGRVAMFPAFLLETAAAQADAQSRTFRVGKVNYPAFTGAFAPFNERLMDGYVISAGTQHPAESWAWIAFLSHQADAEQRTPDRIPARKSVATATQFWEGMDDDTRQAYQAVLEQPARPPTGAPDYTLLGALLQAEQAVMQGTSPAEALQQADTQLASQLAQRPTATPTPPTEAVVVATPAPQTASGAASFVFQPMGLGLDIGTIRTLARTFNEQHPNETVQIKSSDALTIPSSLAEMAQGSDCFAWWSIPKTAQDRAAVLDLQPFFAADASFPQTDYPSALLRPFVASGTIVGLPSTFSPRFLGYNKTLFQAAGVQPPGARWTPDAFLDAAKALTRGSGAQKQYGYVPLGSAASDLAFFIAQFGGHLWSGSGKDLRPTFSDPAVVKAIQWYLDLAAVHGVMPKTTFPYRPSDTLDESAMPRIQQGRGAMWFDGGFGAMLSMPGQPATWAVFPPGTADRTRTWEAGVAPLPIGQAGFQPDDLGVQGFYIAAHTPHAQGCWSWLTFLAAQSDLGGGQFPARSTAAPTHTTDAAQQQLIDQYREALAQPRPSDAGQPTDAATPDGVDMYWFYQAINNAVEKRADLAAGLKKADELTQAHLQCVAETQKPATCAKQVDASYQGYTTEDSPAESSASPTY